MTDNPTDLVPADSVIITPADGQPVRVGYGYIAEGGADVLALTFTDEKLGPQAVLFTPELASEVAVMMAEKALHCAKVRDTRRDEQNGYSE